MAGHGTYTFKWTEPAEEVFVTGTFDEWKMTEKLVKGADSIHLASVSLPIVRTSYKYVVDGKWVADPKQRVEKDSEGNDNNYLLPEDIAPKEDPVLSVPVIPVPDTVDDSVSPFVSSVAPTATTAALAAEVPLEPKRDLEAEAAAKKEEESKPEEPVTISSVGPEATTAALAAEVPLEEKVNEEPIVPEATKVVTAPEDLPTPDPKSVPGFLPDTADTDKDEIVSVNPLPASETPGNPIDLKPGEPVPETTGSITDNVKLDKESYEKADASNLGVGATATAAFAAVTAAVTSAVESVTGKPDETKEGTSSGGIAEAIKNLIPESALPISMKAEEDHSTDTTDTVPAVVTESQTKAEVDPEASAVKEAVEHKKEVEDELIAKTEHAAPVPVTTDAPHADVPEVVRESQAEAGAPLEASASPVAVEAKKEIEAELKSEVKPTEPVPEEPTTKPSETDAVPAVVVASTEKAGEPSEAAANPVAVEAKAAVEEAITKGETKVEPLEPPKKEEPTTAEKAEETAEKVADKVVPESSKADKPAEASSTTAKDEKKKRRVSAFFKKVLAKVNK